METNFIKLTADNTRRAVERARELRPRLEYIQDREWLVYGRNSAEYVVTLTKVHGMILASCTCKAGEAGRVCYHATCAAGAQMGVARARALTAR